MKLIKIAQDHYVIVDDSKISIGDIVAEKLLTGEYELFTIHTLNDIDKLRQKKITHSTQPLEYSSKIGKYWGRVQPIELSEVKELIGEVDKAKEYAKNKYGEGYYPDVEMAYNQALEDNKEKKYTEEDMRKAMSLARKGAYDMTFDSFDNIIQSLQPKTEWEVEFVDGKLALKK